MTAVVRLVAAGVLGALTWHLLGACGLLLPIAITAGLPVTVWVLRDGRRW